MIYKTKGVCCKEMHVDVEDGVIKALTFSSGCNGNLKGIAALAVGRRADEVAAILGGILCGSRPTSCPDQLAIALRDC